MSWTLQYGDENYQRRMEAEQRCYAGCENVHLLPPIFHYWSNRYVRPRFEVHGFTTPEEMFQKLLTRRYDVASSGTRRFLSLGSGNCDLELQLALSLLGGGRGQFVIDCIEINEEMILRGRTGAASVGVSDRLHVEMADLNQWTPGCDYDAVIAHQSLHHIVNLEGLFSGIKTCLKPGAQIGICDTIGRNGNQRWPEAERLVKEFWRRLPPSYRYNQQLRRYEEMIENWDCSKEGFEAIRSQDILPELVSTFEFQLFIGYANIIEPFVSRAFGHNFNADEVWDRCFIDEVHRRDEEGIISGELTPTQMIAVVGNESVRSAAKDCGRKPEEFVRRPHYSTNIDTSSEAITPYEWHSWPHSDSNELEVACQRLAEAESGIRKQREELDQELRERTRWARALERDLEERTAWVLQLVEKDKELTAAFVLLEREFEERTAWALKMDAEIPELRALVDERTLWAQQLDRDNATYSSLIVGLQSELALIQQRSFRHRVRRFYDRMRAFLQSNP